LSSYPDFTAERIKAIHSLHGSLPANCSGDYTVPNMDESRRSQIWSRLIPARLGPPTAINHMDRLAKANPSDSITLSEVACNLADALSPILTIFFNSLLPPHSRSH
ncbi:hypothetical protein M378DRAFT_171441, partial [Amanita muscaria Koide BX008]